MFRLVRGRGYFSCSRLIVLQRISAMQRLIFPLPFVHHKSAAASRLTLGKAQLWRRRSGCFRISDLADVGGERPASFGFRTDVGRISVVRGLVRSPPIPRAGKETGQELFSVVETTGCCWRMFHGCFGDCMRWSADVVYTGYGQQVHIMRMERPASFACCCFNRPVMRIKECLVYSTRNIDSLHHVSAGTPQGQIRGFTDWAT